MSDVRNIRVTLAFGLVVLFTGLALPARSAAQTMADQPSITSFRTTGAEGGVVISGTTTGCPAGTVIILSGPGPIEGKKAEVGPNGGFSVFVPVEGGISGDVGAVAVTSGGQMSLWVMTYLLF